MSVHDAQTHRIVHKWEWSLMCVNYTSVKEVLEKMDDFATTDLIWILVTAYSGFLFLLALILAIFYYVLGSYLFNLGF